MGLDTFGIPIDLAAFLVDRLKLRVAIETGTYRGRSAVQLRNLVSHVWTIEQHPGLARKARERHDAVDGITWLDGHSVEVLPTILANIQEPILFWLDAHWCGEKTAGSLDQCPVLSEIAAIDKAPVAPFSCILIDDARLFLGGVTPPLKSQDWPSFMEIMDALRRSHDRYVTVLLDVIIAGPLPLRTDLEEFWQRRILDGAPLTWHSVRGAAGRKSRTSLSLIKRLLHRTTHRLVGK